MINNDNFHHEKIIDFIYDENYSNTVEYESKWNIIPNKCSYNDKIYNILFIDMEGGYFTLFNSEYENDNTHFLEDIDMDKCTPIL